MTGVTAVSSRITQKSTNWFPKHYEESSVLKKPPISIQQAPLGYGETRHLCYGSKNFKECFQELFKSVPHGRKAVLKANGVQGGISMVYLMYIAASCSNGIFQMREECLQW